MCRFEELKIALLVYLEENFSTTFLSDLYGLFLYPTCGPQHTFFPLCVVDFSVTFCLPQIETVKVMLLM